MCRSQGWQIQRIRRVEGRIDGNLFLTDVSTVSSEREFYPAFVYSPDNRFDTQQNHLDTNDGRDHVPLAIQHSNHRSTRDERSNMAQL
jgi:hypothetical protein